MGTMQWQTERVSLFFRWTMDGQGVLISNSLKQIIVHTSTLVVFPVLLLHLDWELVVGSGQTCVFEFKQNIGGSILNVSITVAIQSNGQISVTHILGCRQTNIQKNTIPSPRVNHPLPCQ